ncbi:MAG: 16S rRNA (guanine(966)-N(2))-methyltransferase RsmD [Acidimicrobiales bacterium]
MRDSGAGGPSIAARLTPPAGSVGAMRVVAGVAKGRRLLAPPGRDVRPTADRVREAMFNSLFSLCPIEGATVLDLFAGTGALGIEALSRGAARAVFVEHDRSARSTLQRNLAETGLAPRATVEAGDALAYLAAAPVPFDLAFCDPPYRFDRWERLLELLASGIAVLESDREVALGPSWELARRKRYGSTVVTIARRAAAELEREQPRQSCLGC